MIKKGSTRSGLFATAVLLGGIATANTALSQDYAHPDATPQGGQDRRCQMLNGDRFVRKADCFAVNSGDQPPPFYPPSSLSSSETSSSDNNPNKNH